MNDFTALGPGREFDLIRALTNRWGTLARGVGDDAALLDVPPGDVLVASVDSVVEGVHFRDGWFTPREIGWRATAAALSDLAAMAAAPLGVLVSLSLPEAWLPRVEDLADGIGEAVASAGTFIVGGNLARAHELNVATTVLGHCARPLRRDGALPGDALYVTGRLGGPVTALRALERGETPSRRARDRFAWPEPRLRAAQWLEAHDAHAAIDISDGLLADAGHVAAASGVRLVMDLDVLPVLPGVDAVTAARGGEEYELLVAAPAALDTAAFACALALPLTRIGHVESGAAEVHASLRGARVAPLDGFDHFS